MGARGELFLQTFNTKVFMTLKKGRSPVFLVEKKYTGKFIGGALALIS